MIFYNILSFIIFEINISFSLYTRNSKIKYFMLIGIFALVKSVSLGFFYSVYTFSGTFIFMVPLVFISLIIITFPKLDYWRFILGVNMLFSDNSYAWMA